jgi:DNA-binding MarR family transcriptional regulator
MLEKSQETLSYLNFLSLVQEVRASSEFKQLSPIEERLLNHLASVWDTERKITVLQAMGVDLEISHSTSHRLLKCLRLKQFIVLLNDERDTRVKYVLPTEKANAYFAALGKCLHQALKTTSS